jgi:hypothetical protein
MNFDQAIHKKETMESSFESDGIAYRIFITPDNFDDFIRYLTEIRGFRNRLSDQDSIKYSSDGKFALHGLSFIGPDVLYKRV